MENKTFEDLLGILEKSPGNYDIEKIKAAYETAREVHEGQFRNSGEAYITHPVAVSIIVAELGLDTDSICAALLHDTVEDCGTKISLDLIKSKFGPDVAMLVDGLTKLISIPFEDKEEQQIENIRKMLLAMSKDIRVIFIKLCDRLHNMRTLSAKPVAKQRTTALETMQVYAPLAHRLGLQIIKQELENIGISYLDPIGCESIKKDIDAKYGENKHFLENAKKAISDKLDENHISHTLEGRVKSPYSIYKKMYGMNKSFDEIYDLFALRIIVNTEGECYQVLGLIHDMYKSIPGRFKDYISTPKPNNYRSLHTTVIGKEGVPFEVQIRTQAMHQTAEYGICAHWKYKTGEKTSTDMDKKLEWVAKLVETEDDTRDPEEFFRALKVDIFHDETFVFTPGGDVITLPYGATVIDFAYAIHSAVGNKMVGAKINGLIVPIDRIPNNGDIVEIITSSSSKGPSRDWLKIVTTSSARTKIRQWFKKERKDENIALGKQRLDSEIKSIGKNISEEQKNAILLSVARRNGIQTVEDLYNTIGFGGIAITKIVNRLQEEIDKLTADEPTVEDISSIKTHEIKKSSNGITVDGLDDCMIKLAHCCNPVPGDSITGFVTRGYGVSIHKTDCKTFLNMLDNPDYKDRFVNAHWDDSDITSSSLFECRLEIYAFDRIGLLAEITAALAEMKVMLNAVGSGARGDNHVYLYLTVGCRNVEHMNQIVSRINSVRGVERCSRIGS